MERVATANTVTLSNGKTGYGDGTPGVTAPTQMDASPLNAIQEEIAGIMEFVGMTLQTSGSETYTQFQTAMRKWLDAKALTSYPNFAAGLGFAGGSGTPSAICMSNGSGGYVVAVGSNGGIWSNSPTLKNAWTVNAPAGAYTGQFNGCAGKDSGSILFVIVGTTHEIETSTSPAASSAWTQRTPANSFVGTFYSAAYSPSLALFCIVGSGGEIQTSSDGTTWTHRTAAASFAGNFQAVCWSPDLAMFCAVGASGTIQTSTDGITWTSRTPGSSYAGTFGAVGAGLVAGTAGFVAMGTGANSTQYSTNGTSWTASTTSTGASASNPNQMVFLPSTSGGVWTVGGFFSMDGITWRSSWVYPGSSGLIALPVSTTYGIPSSAAAQSGAIQIITPQNGPAGVAGISDFLGGYP